MRAVTSAHATRSRGRSGGVAAVGRLRPTVSAQQQPQQQQRSLYRRHRPRTFAEVVGQEPVVRTLRNAVERGKVHHAYLFVGSRGTGKTSMAKILAACLNCERGPTIEPCGECDSCLSIARATSLDVIEMDAASNNSVDDIRELRESVAYAPVSGRRKVYILDEAHMLSTAAWNAFLKTLEEPPPNTVFVLATTEAQQGARDRRRPLPPLRLPPPHRRADRQRRAPRRAGRVDRDPRRGGRGARALGHRQLPRRARHARAARHLQRQRDRARGRARRARRGRRAAARRDRRRGRRGRRAARAAGARGVRRAGSRRGLVRLRPGGARARAARRADARRGARRAVAHAGGRRRPAGAGRARRPRRRRSCACWSCSARRWRACARAPTPARAWSSRSSRPPGPRSTPRCGALLARIERLERAGTSAPSPPSASRPRDAPRRPVAGAGDARPRRHVRRPAGAARPTGSEASAAPWPQAPPTRGAPAEPPPRRSLRSRRLAVGRRGDLESLRSLWPAVVDLVRAENALLGALIEEARPVAVDGEDLTLAFASTAQFLKKKAEDPANRVAVGEALRPVTGGAGGSPMSCARAGRARRRRPQASEHRGGVGEALHGGVRRRGDPGSQPGPAPVGDGERGEQAVTSNEKGA